MTLVEGWKIQKEAPHLPEAQRIAPNEKVQLTTKVDPGIKDLVLRVAKAYGMDTSQYLRQLVIKDLEEHGLMKERLKSLASSGEL